MEQFKKGQLVLVRNREDHLWIPGLYHSLDLTMDYLGDEDYRWSQIIPYEGNEHLAGTSDSPKPQPKEGEWWLCSDQNCKKMVLLRHNDKWFWQPGNECTHTNTINPVYRMVEDKL